jgi:4-amino-4-deoxy-L-arabinose transferase-like glycosyltransferase
MHYSLTPGRTLSAESIAVGPLENGAGRALPAPPHRRAFDRWAPALLLIGAAALYLVRLGWVSLYDDDESVYAEIGREMLLLKDWLTPHLNFIPYLEKPPLFYWLDAAAFQLLGLSEFSARLPTALAAIAGIGCVYGLGRDLWGRRAGLAAGAVLATSFGYFVFGRMMMPDMLFVGLLTAAFWGFIRALVEAPAPRWAVFGGYAAMGGAVLAKGVIGLIFPGLAVGAFLTITRDWRLLRRLELARGGALFLAIALPWHVLMERNFPGFLRYYLVDKHVYRFLGHPELLSTVSLPVPTYLAMTLAWFCPWSAFLPAAIRRCWPRTLGASRADQGSLLVLLWAGSVIGFFALSASRLEYYALPALPALALCVGRLWGGELTPQAKTTPSSRLRMTWLGLIASVVCLAPAAWLFPRLEHLRFYNLFPLAALPADSAHGAALATAKVYDVPGFARLVPLLETVVALLVAGTAVSAWAWFSHRPRVALACFVGAVAIGLATLERGFLLYAPYRSVATLAAVLRGELQPGEQVMMEGRFEHHAGMAFYTGQPVGVYRGHQGILLYGARYVGTEGRFIGDEEFARRWQGPERTYLLSDAPNCLTRLQALAPGTVLLGRTGNSWLLANRPAARLAAVPGSWPPRAVASLP